MKYQQISIFPKIYFLHFINVLFRVMFEIFNHFLNVLYQITFLSQLPSIADGFVSALFFSLGKIKSALRIVVHLIENRKSIETLFFKTLLLRSNIKFKTRGHLSWSPWSIFYGRPLTTFLSKTPVDRFAGLGTLATLTALSASLSPSLRFTPLFIYNIFEC